MRRNEKNEEIYERKNSTCWISIWKNSNGKRKNLLLFFSHFVHFAVFNGEGEKVTENWEKYSWYNFSFIHLFFVSYVCLCFYYLPGICGVNFFFVHQVNTRRYVGGKWRNQRYTLAKPWWNDSESISPKKHKIPGEYQENTRQIPNHQLIAWYLSGGRKKNSPNLAKNRHRGKKLANS